MAADGEDRCPNCGALVGVGAEWCGQCYASLGPEEAPAGESSPADPEAALAEAIPGATAPAGGETESPTWPCAVCGSPNALESDFCTVCGMPFGAGFEEPSARPEVQPKTAVVSSCLLPGLGHMRCGRWVEGTVSTVLFVWAIGCAAAFLLFRPETGRGAFVPVAIVFFLAALAVYTLAALDAFRISSGVEPLASARALLWISVGMLVWTGIALVIVLGRSILPGSVR